MKKFLSLILTIAMVLSLGLLAGCKNEVLVVGYTIYEPMNYKDADGNLVGFDTELAKAVFENLGYDVLFQEIKWENKYTDLNSGTIDCIWNGFTANTADDDGVARSSKVDFSYNYMENEQVVVAKKDAGFTDAASLAGKLGAVEGGSAGESYAKDTFAGATVKDFTKQTECILEVNAGTADFAVVDAQLAKSYVGKGDYANLAIVAGIESEAEYYAIGFKKESELTAQVNASLKRLAANGTITTIAKKYKVENTAVVDFADQDVAADEK